MGIYVETYTSYDMEEDENFDINKISWYSVKAKLCETQQEKDEKKMAIKYQIDNNILQRNGLPVGMSEEQYKKYKQETTPKKPEKKLSKIEKKALKQRQKLEKQNNFFKQNMKKALDESKQEELRIKNQFLLDRSKKKII